MAHQCSCFTLIEFMTGRLSIHHENVSVHVQTFDASMHLQTDLLFHADITPRMRSVFSICTIAHNCSGHLFSSESMMGIVSTDFLAI